MTVLTWGLFRQTNDAYRMLKRQPAGQLILADLAQFCRATRPSMHAGDSHMTAFNEGKRAVWLRIQERLRLTDDELFAILGGATLPPNEDDDDA